MAEHNWLKIVEQRYPRDMQHIVQQQQLLFMDLVWCNNLISVAGRFTVINATSQYISTCMIFKIIS